MGEPEPVEVLWYAGGQADEVPRALVLDGRRVAVAEVVARWLAEIDAPGGSRQRGFRVRLEDGRVMTIVRAEGAGVWRRLS